MSDEAPLPGVVEGLMAQNVEDPESQFLAQPSMWVDVEPPIAPLLGAEVHPIAQNIWADEEFVDAIEEPMAHNDSDPELQSLAPLGAADEPIGQNIGAVKDLAQPLLAAAVEPIAPMAEVELPPPFGAKAEPVAPPVEPYIIPASLHRLLINMFGAAAAEKAVAEHMASQFGAPQQAMAAAQFETPQQALAGPSGAQQQAVTGPSGGSQPAMAGPSGAPQAMAGPSGAPKQEMAGPSGGPPRATASPLGSVEDLNVPHMGADEDLFGAPLHMNRKVAECERRRRLKMPNAPFKEFKLKAPPSGAVEELMSLPMEVVNLETARPKGRRRRMFRCAAMMDVGEVASDDDEDELFLGFGFCLPVPAPSTTAGPSPASRDPASPTRHPCSPCLQGVPEVVFGIIFKYLNLKEKKALRLVNHDFLNRIEFHTRTDFKLWRLVKISSGQLKELAEQARTMKGLEITTLSRGSTVSVDDALEAVAINHPEIRFIKIELSGSAGTSVTHHGLQAVLTLEDLHTLHLNNTSITGDELDPALDYSPVLETLSLVSCHFQTSQGFSSLLSVTGERLRVLDLGGTNISFKEIASISIVLGQLEKLSLENCMSLTEEALVSILNKTGERLGCLNVAGTNLTFADMSGISRNLDALQELNLTYCRMMTDGGLTSLLSKTGPSLKVLNLDNTNIALTDVSMTANLPKLETLTLSCCKSLTEAGLIALVDLAQGNLRTLKLADTNLTFSAFPFLAQPLTNLQALDMYQCKNLTDDNLTSILNKIGEDLRSLNLVGTNLSLLRMDAVTNNFPRLETLSMYVCASLREPGLVSLLNRTGRNLQRLYIYGTPVCRDRIHKRFPDIEFLY